MPATVPMDVEPEARESPQEAGESGALSSGDAHLAPATLLQEHTAGSVASPQQAELPFVEHPLQWDPAVTSHEDVTEPIARAAFAASNCSFEASVGSPKANLAFWAAEPEPGLLAFLSFFLYRPYPLGIVKT